MPPSFQRHFSPVPLRHFYSIENVLDPPSSPLRTSYPLEDPGAGGPAGKLSSTPRKLPESTAALGSGGQMNANIFQAGQLARLSSSSELTILPTPSTSNTGDCTIPGEIRQGLGLDTSMLCSLRIYIQEQSKIKLKPKTPFSKQSKKAISHLCTAGLQKFPELAANAEAVVTELIRFELTL